MNKRNVFRLTTLLTGLLAIGVSLPTNSVSGSWPHGTHTGTALGLLSAIFATQWIEYQKRQDAVSPQPGWPGWLRRLLY